MSQRAHSGIFIQRPPTRPDQIQLPIAVAANQPPCIKPLYFGGATLETKEMPIGLRKSSAIVMMK